ncbi:hypothetical protein PAXRUDRAFT_177491, partial [Paxillus rubicundulus Ve08.2h10]
FNTALPLSSMNSPHSPQKPCPYKSGLTPKLSSLRPHCLAKDRLCLWIPASPSLCSASLPQPPPILETMLDRILHVIGASWTDSIKELYSTGLLIFHVYSNLNQVMEPKCCPISPTLLLTFLSSCTGAYSSSAIANYASTLHARHILHGHPWSIQPDELNTILNDEPKGWSLDDSQGIPSSWEILSTSSRFLNLPGLPAFGIMANGEYLPLEISKFNSLKHITRANLLHLQDPEGLPVMKFCIPFTKCSTTGEDTQCAPLPGCITDPQATLKNHFRVNPAPQDAHLFSWKHPKSGLCPLSKTKVTSRLTAVSKACSLSNLKGHNLWIGGTLHYLLKGVPLDVVKVMGFWARNSFMLYLHDHTLILVLFLQATDKALGSFNHFTMPPVR